MHNIVKSKYSKGFLRDLASLHLAVGILSTADDKDTTIRHNDNKLYKVNKRIDRKIKRLNQATLECNIGDFTMFDKLFMKQLSEKALLSLVKEKFSYKPSYELISLYMLYYRFIDGRKKPLDERFEFIKSDKIFDISISISDIVNHEGLEEMKVARKLADFFN